MQDQQNNDNNNICDNFYLKNQDLIQEDGNFYNINFSVVNLTKIKKRLLFKLIHNLDCNNTNKKHNSCEECFDHLTTDETKLSNKPKNTWTSFVCHVLTDNSIN